MSQVPAQYRVVRGAHGVVLCHGCFDLLHVGHLYLFKSAREYGDYLIVSIVGDAWVRKGPGRPIFNEHQRAEMLDSLRQVDKVVITDRADWWNDHLRTYKPDYYVRGNEGKVLPEHETLDELGIKLILIDKTDSSTTAIADRIART